MHKHFANIVILLLPGQRLVACYERTSVSLLSVSLYAFVCASSCTCNAPEGQYIEVLRSLADTDRQKKMQSFNKKSPSMLRCGAAVLHSACSLWMRPYFATPYYSPKHTHTHPMIRPVRSPVDEDTDEKSMEGEREKKEGDKFPC
uniref:Putative secreted protein n=1 Tax=Anopheles darlingi TaxID=43151 RepID=A0A2M4D811_ANODA